MKTHLQTILLALPLVALAACDSTDPGDGAGEGELITRVTITLTPTNSGAVATATYNDANRNGVIDNGEFTTLNLRASTSYTGTITFAGPDEDVTAEVRAEADDHQVIYTPGGGAAGRVSITTTDRDGNNLPLGLQFTAAVTGGAAATGTLRVALWHYDGIPKQAGVPSAEADFDGAFPVTITP